METEIAQHMLVSEGVPTAVLAAASAALLLLWARMRRWTDAARGVGRATAFAAGAMVGFLTLLALAETAQRYVVFATRWPVLPVLLGGAVVAEILAALYRLERRVCSRRAGRLLLALRLVLLLAVVLMLCQPVFVLERARRVRREVAVVLDDSASMRVADNNMTSGEKVRLAEALEVPGVRRAYRLERLASRARTTREQLLAQADWLTSLPESDPVSRTRQLAKRSKVIRAAMEEALDLTAEATNAAAAAAASGMMQTNKVAVTNLAELVRWFAVEADAPLRQAREACRAAKEAETNTVDVHAALLDGVRRAAAAFAEADLRLAAAGNAADEACYQALGEVERKACDRLAEVPRAELARRLLLDQEPAAAGETGLATNVPSPGRGGLLGRLDASRGARIYQYAVAPAERRLDEVMAVPPETNAAAALLVPGRQRSDLASALEKVAADMPARQTAGILLVTDGRHNALKSVEPIARRLGLQQTPVFALALGDGARPPTDAAFAAVEAPDSVSTNDRVTVRLELKLDGLAGSNVTVRLFDGETAVASNSVTPNAASFRRAVQLSDAPKTNGLHSYRVELDSFGGEVNTNNNRFAIPVWVNSDPIKVLLLEGYPRWEFRYLKNLFNERDRNVRLQYVLFHPDRIAGISNAAPRAASAAAGTEPAESEAARPPETEAEWMKFDLIVLGDVDPAELGRAAMETLRRFVSDRGGTLIAIAGRRHLPHAYAGTPLADLLPVVCRASARPLLGSPEPACRIRLTREGRAAAFMSLADDAAANEEAWNEVPALYWRHAIESAKEGAAVLAYAAPSDAPEPGAEQTGGAPQAVGDEEQAVRQRETERRNALVASQHIGVGNVLFLGFDQTWRLRYRKGDPPHHKFWGQVTRWATADRLPAGTQRVRLGTDSPRYTVDAPIRVRARLTSADFAPITNATVRVAVRQGEREVLRRNLLYVSDSPGVYAADIGSLPEGAYRVALEVEGAAAETTSEAGSVSSEFAVGSEASSETVELSADRGLLERLASLTGGEVLDAADLADLAKKLGPSVVTTRERRQIDLWNSWPLFLVAIAAATAEWLLRKKERLP